jgi:hypothetical protein
MKELVNAEAKQGLDPLIIRGIRIDPTCTDNMQEGKHGNQEERKI